MDTKAGPAAIGADHSVLDGAEPSSPATLALVDRFDALLEAGQRISTALSPPAIFAAVREAALTLLRGERCVVVQLSAGGVRPGFLADLGEAESREPCSSAMIERALALGRPVVYGEGLAQEAGGSALVAGVRSLLCAPIMVRGRPFACFEVTHARVGGLFGKDEERLARFIAALAGAALENAAGVAALEAARERQAAEEARHKSVEMFRSLIENASDVTAVLALDGTLRYTSPSFDRILGYGAKELIGEEFFRFVHPDDLPFVSSALRRAVSASGKPVVVEFRLREAGGKWRTFEAIGKHILDDAQVGTLIFNARDLTERNELEGQLRQLQKIDAIGRLAGGVAHDFNNLLTVILGYADLIAARLGPAHLLHDAIEQIHNAGTRAAALTHQLLAFSRKQMLAPAVLDLNTLIANVEKMLLRLIGENIEVVTHLAVGLPSIKADPGQIEQVIINLAVNARDAMPEGGKLTIETSAVELDESYARERADVRPGSYVMLAVTDTGVGIDAQTKAHLFEPFFTTKATGKGTGLGLATVYGIVKQSGGNIWVYSEPGRGTTFRIYLPQAHAPVAESADGEGPDSAARGSETVLLVEDEQSLRSLVQLILTGSGFRVLAAASGEEAETLARGHDGPIHLILSDVVMPGMGGVELARRLSAVRPQACVMFMSGYTHAGAQDQGVGTERRSFLQKPFTPATVVRRVREVLDARPSGAAAPGAKSPSL